MKNAPSLGACLDCQASLDGPRTPQNILRLPWMDKHGCADASELSHFYQKQHFEKVNMKFLSTFITVETDSVLEN